LKYYTERSSVNDSTGDEDSEQMVQTHESDFSTVIDVLKQGMSIAEEANDETTGVMLLDIH
jgi:starvation-inducible DNA-binding protein